jgi:hypothetical protein
MGDIEIAIFSGFVRAKVLGTNSPIMIERKVMDETTTASDIS